MPSHCRKIVLGLSITLLAITPKGLSGAEFWVTPTGNDAWTGQLREPNAGKTDGPLATIGRAQEAVRQLRKSGPQREPVRVAILGRVALDRPIVITPEESGTRQSPTVYQGVPEPGRAVLSGGRVIAGWKKGPGELYTVQIPEVQAGKWYFRQLFVDDRRAQRARAPQNGYYRVLGLAQSSPKAGWEKGVDRFRYRPGDLQGWRDWDAAEIVLFHSWNTSRLRIRSLDPGSHLVTFTGPSVFRPLAWDPDQRYYVENARELLVAPGQWHLDRKTGVLAYWPLTGEDMAKVRVVAPRLSELVRFEGNPDTGKFVDYVQLHGLVLAHADWSLDERGYGDPQAAVTVPAVVSARGARHCEIRQCEIAHVGTYGIWFSRGCKNNRIEDNHLHDLGAGGIRLGEPVMPPSDVTESSGNRIAGNYIHDGGIVYPGAVGLWLAQSSHNEICHNEIHDFNYSGISIGWNWNEARNRTHHNRIEFNHVHHVVRGVLSDAGGIYTLGTQTGTVIRNNVFHDIFPYMGQPAMAWGIYCDQGSNGLLVENNIVYNTLTGGLMNTGGPGNVVRNNIFAFSAWQAVWRYTFLHAPPTRVERNIFYLTQGSLFHEDAGQTDTQSEWDRNLYWRTDGRPLEFYDDDFAAWQAKGLDRQGRVADPRFVDPSQYDFRLAPDSPALQLGFQPIDTSHCGLVPPDGLATWNLAAMARKVHFPATRLPPAPAVQSPVPIDDGFESTPVGELPAGAVVQEEGPADRIRVSRDTSAAGRQSLKFIDAPGLKHVFDPHLYYAPHFRTGRAVLRFDLRVEPGAIVAHEWRDGRQPYRVGPSLQIDARRRLLVCGKPLAEVPLSTWFHVEILCELGPEATGHYDLVLALPGSETQRFPGLACGSVKFDRLEWLGFVSLANEKAIFYLDNIQLMAADAVPVGPPHSKATGIGVGLRDTRPDRGK